MCTEGLKKLDVFNLEKRHLFCKDFTYVIAAYTEVVRGYRQEGEGCLLEVRGGSLRGKEHKSKHGKFQCCEKSFLLWKMTAEHLNRCPARFRELCRCAEVSWMGLMQPDLDLPCQCCSTWVLEHPTNLHYYLEWFFPCFAQLFCLSATQWGLEVCDWMIVVQKKNLDLTIALNSNNAYRNQLEKVQLKYNSEDAWRLQQWSSEMMPHHLFSLNGISQLVRYFSLSVNGESIQTSRCKSEGKF